MRKLVRCGCDGVCVMCLVRGRRLALMGRHTVGYEGSAQLHKNITRRPSRRSADTATVTTVSRVAQRKRLYRYIAMFFLLRLLLGTSPATTVPPVSEVTIEH